MRQSGAIGSPAEATLRLCPPWTAPPPSLSLPALLSRKPCLRGGLLVYCQAPVLSALWKHRACTCSCHLSPAGKLCRAQAGRARAGRVQAGRQGADMAQAGKT